MAEPLRLLIVDDEPLARLRLRSLVDELASALAGGIQLADDASDAGEALQRLQTGPVDALLLDIGLPGRDGLRLAAALRALPRPPAVVFVTAHGEHALRAFELDAVDYLTKPVRRERLREALQRVLQRRAPALATAAGDDMAAGAPVLVVSDRGRVIRLPLAELLLARAEQKYVTLVTVAHRYVVDEPLAEIEARLGEGVLRVHRSVLVARHAVRALAAAPEGAEEGADGWAVQVAGLPEDQAWVPVSRRQLAAVREALAQAGR